MRALAPEVRRILYGTAGKTRWTKGTGFSPYVKCFAMNPALAAEGCLLLAWSVHRSDDRIPHEMLVWNLLYLFSSTNPACGSFLWNSTGAS
jgi:hypothetical protein